MHIVMKLLLSLLCSSYLGLAVELGQQLAAEPAEAAVSVSAAVRATVAGVGGTMVLQWQRRVLNVRRDAVLKMRVLLLEGQRRAGAEGREVVVVMGWLLLGGQRWVGGVGGGYVRRVRGLGIVWVVRRVVGGVVDAGRRVAGRMDVMALQAALRAWLSGPQDV